jgi:hypothetical protein
VVMEAVVMEAVVMELGMAAAPCPPQPLTRRTFPASHSELVLCTETGV